MKTTLQFLFFIFCGNCLYAQNDSISIHKRPSLVLAYDGRFSLIKKEIVNIAGLKIGVDFKNKFRVGAGVYGLLKPIVYDGTVSRSFESKSRDIPFHASLKLWYAAIYGEYVIIHKRRWEISAPIQFGYGKTIIDAQPVQKENAVSLSLLNKNDINSNIYLIEPTITGYYKIFNWIGIGGGIGYRKMLNSDDRINKILDNPIVFVRASIFLGDFVDVISGFKPAFRYIE